MDIIDKIVKEGKLLTTGLNPDLSSYRVFELEGNKFKLQLTKYE
jgi:hypothetical protein